MGQKKGRRERERWGKEHKGTKWNGELFFCVLSLSYSRTISHGLRICRIPRIVNKEKSYEKFPFDCILRTFCLILVIFFTYVHMWTKASGFSSKEFSVKRPHLSSLQLHDWFRFSFPFRNQRGTKWPREKGRREIEPRMAPRFAGWNKRAGNGSTQSKNRSSVEM